MIFRNIIRKALRNGIELHLAVVTNERNVVEYSSTANVTTDAIYRTNKKYIAPYTGTRDCTRKDREEMPGGKILA